MIGVPGDSNEQRRDVLVRRFPRLYHMANFGAWPSIVEHGLRSTSALLDLFEVDGEDRFRIERKIRKNSVEISHAKYGRAVIRDQKPLFDGALRKCLTDMSPAEWCLTLNSRVFFWPTQDRVLGLLRARAYRNDAHCVITLDTALVLNQHWKRVCLSPINSGSTLYNPRPRAAARPFVAPKGTHWGIFVRVPAHGLQKSPSTTTCGT